jgi:hypothetical protein
MTARDEARQAIDGARRRARDVLARPVPGILDRTDADVAIVELARAIDSLAAVLLRVVG